MMHDLTCLMNDSQVTFQSLYSLTNLGMKILTEQSIKLRTFSHKP